MIIYIFNLQTKGQSRIDIPEKRATLCRTTTKKPKTQHRKATRIIPKKAEVNLICGPNPYPVLQTI